MLAAVIAVSFVSLFILQAFGIVYYEDGIKLNSELFDSFKNAWYGWIIVILFQLLLTSLLCFIPGISMAFILLLQAMYDKPWQAFLIAFIGVVVSSSLLYILGRFGGHGVCVKLLGEKDCQKASDLLNNKGVIYFPIMMLFPVFPDDALVMIAGTLKMSLKWFIPSIVIARGIGIATIVFGISIVPFDKFTSPWHWIGFVLFCIVGIVAVFYAANRLNKYLETRREHKSEDAE